MISDEPTPFIKRVSIVLAVMFIVLIVLVSYFGYTNSKMQIYKDGSVHCMTFNGNEVQCANNVITYTSVGNVIPPHIYYNSTYGLIDVQWASLGECHDVIYQLNSNSTLSVVSNATNNFVPNCYYEFNHQVAGVPTG